MTASVRRLKSTATSWAIGRLIAGVVLLAVLAYYMWSPGDWPVKLFVWVLLTILLDELGGWFGYLGLLAAGLAFLSPYAPPAQWLIIVPLIGGGLFALLLVKHSGGAFVLPFAGAVFMLPILGAAKFGPQLDPGVTLPAHPDLQRNATLAMLLGLTVSLVRQLVGLWQRRRERLALQSVIPAEVLPAAVAPLPQTRGWHPEQAEAGAVATEHAPAPVLVPVDITLTGAPAESGQLTVEQVAAEPAEVEQTEIDQTEIDQTTSPPASTDPERPV